MGSHFLDVLLIVVAVCVSPSFEAACEELRNPVCFGECFCLLLTFRLVTSRRTRLRFRSVETENENFTPKENLLRTLEWVGDVFLRGRQKQVFRFAIFCLLSL